MKKKLTMINVLVILLCSFFTQSFAEDLTDLYNKQNEIEAQKSEATTKLEIIKEDLSESLIQVQTLSQSIAEYQEQIDSLDGSINELQESITDLEERLVIAQEDYDKKKKAIDTRLLAMYESGQTKYLDVLLKSKSLSDLIGNYYILSVLTEYDTMFLEDINEQKENMIKNKETLENNKKEINAKREEKETTSIILQNSLTMKNNYMAKLTEEERQIEEAIEKYQEELNQIEKEIIEVTLTSISPEYIGGEMAWPVPGYTVITSNYGMRTHPITGVYKLHTGVDLRAPMGANFVAANSGVVIKVSEGGAYGKMVMIDHGGGISTLYAHGSEILVELGQTVVRGTPVLKVGSTGYSTGPHAHFEVRERGVPVDPIPYITNIPTNSETNETGENTN